MIHTLMLGIVNSVMKRYALNARGTWFVSLMVKHIIAHVKNAVLK